MTVRQIRVDFTSQGSGGRVRARIANADGPIFRDDQVLAVDPDDQLCADAIVADMQGPFAYLNVDWSTQRDLDSDTGSVGGTPQCKATVLTWNADHGFLAKGPENTGTGLAIRQTQSIRIWSLPLVQGVDPQQSRVLTSP